MKEKIKYIIFDLGEVLISGIRDTGLALKEKHEIGDGFLGHNLGWAKVKTPLLVPLVEEFFNGNISEDTYIAAVLEGYPDIGTQEGIKALIRENFREVEGTREIVVQLRKLGYKTAILSIHGKEWVDYLENKFKFHQLFDARSYSYEDKVSKPNPSAFKNVLRKLNAKPDECLFIDDHDRNIEGAKALGIAAILFTDSKNLRTELEKYLSDFKS